MTSSSALPSSARPRLAFVALFARAFTRRIGLLLTVAVLASAGCGGSDAGTPAAGATNTRPAGPTTVVTPASQVPSGTPVGPQTGFPGATGTATRPAPSSGRPVTLVRAGGFAGTTQQVAVDERGRWVFRGPSGESAAESGTLTPVQRTRLWELLATPGLAAEAKRMVKPPTCADGYSYTLTTGSITVFWQACGGGTPDVAGDIARLLVDATPL